MHSSADGETKADIHLKISDSEEKKWGDSGIADREWEQGI